MLNRTFDAYETLTGLPPYSHSVQQYDFMAAAWGMSVEALLQPYMLGAFGSLFSGFLDTSPDFRWKGSGPGIETEILRGWSALLGRGFGRGYLRKHYNIRYLTQVEIGTSKLFPALRLAKSRSMHGRDLPDWYGIDFNNNCLAVAEAKGNYAKPSTNLTKPQPLVTRALLQSSNLELMVGNKSCQRKNWAIAHFWGREKTGNRTKVYAADPMQGRYEFSQQEFEKLKKEFSFNWQNSIAENALKIAKAGNARSKLSEPVRVNRRGKLYVAIGLDRFGYFNPNAPRELTADDAMQSYVILVEDQGDAPYQDWAPRDHVFDRDGIIVESYKSI